MNRVRVGLRPVVSKINLPTVIKTAILPGESTESLFIATQVGEIFYLGESTIDIFLDIRDRIQGIFAGGYDERGLLGLAFHPEFHNNGLFYLHYSVAGTEGPGALDGSFFPDPCNPDTFNMKWVNRDDRYDHIDTVEEWVLNPGGIPEKLRTILNLRRPFSNHNGVNSLNFSPETGQLILTTGDGGSGYDPFNLSQDNMEISGKIIEIDVTNDIFSDSAPVVSRFDELPIPVQEAISVIAKGVRNIPGISFQRLNNGQYIKYVGNVGQDLVESVYTFVEYSPIPVVQFIDESKSEPVGFINLGWRGWEGDFPTCIIRNCPTTQNEIITAYYDEAIGTSSQRQLPLISYYHNETGTNKFKGSALTGVQPYMGNEIRDLQGKIIFSDFAQQEETPGRGALAYTNVRENCKLNDYGIIEIDYDFGMESAYYVSLGTNRDLSKIYLGIYASSSVTDLHRGTVFEIVP